MAYPRPLLIAIAAAAHGVACSVLFDPSDLGSGAAGGATASTTAVTTMTTAVASTGASTGSSSSTGVSPCAGETCSGRGICDDTSGVAVCMCEFRFAGDHCENCNDGYQGPACAACATGYQDEDDDGTCLLACTPDTCSGAGLCSDASGVATCSCDPRFDGPTCADPCPPGTAGAGCAYHIVLGMDVPDPAEWAVPADLPYDIDETDSAITFSRVAYRLVLDDEQVWVELDAFTDDATMLGVPVDWIWQVDVTNVLVTSLAGGLDSITTPTAGNVEMWNQCYDEGIGPYDAHDICSPSEVDCYGSFQVHVADHTVLAFNAWAGTHAHVDIGIGESPAGNPDWTFRGNGATYGTRRLEVYVK